MSALNAFELSIGADQTLRYTVYTDETQTVVRDVTGFHLRWMLKRRVNDSDEHALIDKDSADSDVTITGTFHADPDTNTQRVLVPIARADSVDLKPGLAFSEIKRMDDGFAIPLSPEPDQVTLVRGVVRS